MSGGVFFQPNGNSANWAWITKLVTAIAIDFSSSTHVLSLKCRESSAKAYAMFEILILIPNQCCSWFIEYHQWLSLINERTNRRTNETKSRNHSKSSFSVFSHVMSCHFMSVMSVFFHVMSCQAMLCYCLETHRLALEFACMSFSCHCTHVVFWITVFLATLNLNPSFVYFLRSASIASSRCDL